MDRRRFLLRSSGAVALPLVMSGLPMHAFDGPMLADMFNTAEETDRVLVLVQLNGGNDGVNTVLPLDQEAAYMAARPGLAIPFSKTLRLNDTTALHPQMTGLQALFGEKKLAIVNGVGYPNPNLSHFRSTDIWMSGSASNQVVSSGWIGRYLSTAYAGYPDGFPNATMPDPIAIQMSAVVSLALTGASQQSMGIALQDPGTFYALVNSTKATGQGLPTSAEARANVEYVREIQAKSEQYSAVIKAAADKASNIADYPDPLVNRLAGQLQVVARMIAGGLKTRVYVVSLGGFDTHAAQVEEGNPEGGLHATLLNYVSEAMAAFQRDLEAHRVDDRVVTMTFSEFGRRVDANLSLGTDHGTAAPMFVMGTPVVDGVLTAYPSLSDVEQGNLKMAVDFRQIYASILEQWFGANPAVLREVLFQDVSTMPIIKAGSTDPTSVSADAIAGALTLMPVVPNPVRDEARLRYSVADGNDARLDVFDALGFHVATVTGQLNDGVLEAPFVVRGLPSGTYIVRLSNGRTAVTQPMVVIR
jgi:uncharacterized protein (DUF1501 family)